MRVLLLTWVLTAIILDRTAFSEETTRSTTAVEEAVVAAGLENLTPIGSGVSFNSDVGKLYCYSRIRTPTPPTSIKHLWFHEDKLVMIITLPVKSSNWRTYSTKTILPSFKGAWKVDITAEDGTILKTVNFTIH